ncbi:uncharacterized protein LOC143247801 isoform X2 [Tachypleus tridentatus]|uniref:uncharacterized protein LOC143247801 isoform X2 n=1 Tax=Tachypleus tridentatus TaxID=6853 RepID=UPI003FD49EFC
MMKSNTSYEQLTTEKCTGVSPFIRMYTEQQKIVRKVVQHVQEKDRKRNTTQLEHHLTMLSLK